MHLFVFVKHYLWTFGLSFFLSVSIFASPAGRPLQKELEASFKDTCIWENFRFPKPDFGNCPQEGNPIKSWAELISEGILSVEWEAYGFFRAIWEDDYNKRYKNHYSGAAPEEITFKGRKMYEQPWKFDAGDYLFQRLIAGEQKIANLLIFGWVVKKGDDGKVRLLPPPSFKQFYEGFYTGLEHYRNFYHKKGIEIGIPLVEISNQNSQMFLRPGLDAPVESTKWRASKISPEDGVNAPYESFVSTVGNRVFPMQPCMFDHDFAHIIDYLSHEDILKGNTKVMKELSLGALHLSTEPHRDYPGFALGIRVGLLHEELVLPDLMRAPLIKSLLHEVFENSLLQNMESAPQTLAKQYLEVLLDRAELLNNYINSLVVRHGGGMSDPYNLRLELNVRSTAEKRLLLALNSNLATPSPYFALGGRELFSQLAVDSLFGIADDVAWLATLLKKGDLAIKDWIEDNLDLYDFEEKKSKLFTLFYDRLARLQVAFFQGISLQLSGKDFIEESSSLCIARDSKVFKFYQSFAIPGTLYYQAYCDERVFNN